MHRYQILIEYVGTNFIGWQIQSKGQSIQKFAQMDFHLVPAAHPFFLTGYVFSEGKLFQALLCHLRDLHGDSLSFHQPALLQEIRAGTRNDSAGQLSVREIRVF